jgi:hypothetical protein
MHATRLFSARRLFSAAPTTLAGTRHTTRRAGASGVHPPNRRHRAPLLSLEPSEPESLTSPSTSPTADRACLPAPPPPPRRARPRAPSGLPPLWRRVDPTSPLPSHPLASPPHPQPRPQQPPRMRPWGNAGATGPLAARAALSPLPPLLAQDPDEEGWSHAARSGASLHSAPHSPLFHSSTLSLFHSFTPSQPTVTWGTWT